MYSVSLTLVTLPPVASTLEIAVPLLVPTVRATVADLLSLESTALPALTVGTISRIGSVVLMPATFTCTEAVLPAWLVTVMV